ncbi:MAG: 4Fe-4S binding protein [Syntrophorhabdaceae bacterium]|nr:4Fe-4S binding protein [Syntrophorhabdaceae bacterium]
MVPRIDAELCIGCKRCIEVCPPQTIYIQDEKAIVDPEFCEECGFCAAECPVNAILIEFPSSMNK